MNSQEVLYEFQAGSPENSKIMQIIVYSNATILYYYLIETNGVTAMIFYHGSCTAAGISNMLIPPSDSGTVSEKGRKKNLDKVFFTSDIGLARIYAGRAARSIGGEPILYRVVSPVNTFCMNSTPGATVYHADWAFVEKI